MDKRVFIIMFFPIFGITQMVIIIIPISADNKAIIGQLRVWPFHVTTIMAFGERNRNPGHLFAEIGYLI